MDLERIRSQFCIDEKMVLKLKRDLYNIVDEIVKLQPSLKKQKEYNDYISCSSSDKEEKRLKLISTEIGERFCVLTEKYNIVKQSLNDELGKIYKVEFDEIIRSSNCEHLYYATGNGNVCLKCVCCKKIMNDSLKEKEKKEGTIDSSILSRRKFNRKILRQFLSSSEDLREKKYTMVSDIVQVEALDYVLLNTLNFLKINPNMSSDALQQRLEVIISKMNLDFVEGMDLDLMDEETRKRYEAYKKHL